MDRKVAFEIHTAMAVLGMWLIALFRHHDRYSVYDRGVLF